MDQNLLWQDGNVYLMDNHRAALWCWQQHIDLRNQRHSILHIDRHYDALRANLDAHMAEMPDLGSLEIKEYLQTLVKALGFMLFRWDNYLSLHIESFAPQLEDLICLTHRDGDRPEHASLTEVSHFDAPENLETWMRGTQWIVNIDLDYFFCNGSGDQFIRAVSDEYLRFVQVAAAYERCGKDCRAYAGSNSDGLHTRLGRVPGVKP
ncbi:hypothetical protein DMC47_27045 [Nostoc sp. 3335mG]|nr:hypothetical protein DMC47_27045 [Nostoc sp. 3335mG]